MQTQLVDNQLTALRLTDNQLIDPSGRTFPYLRLSITDVCNFSCQYCLPNGYRCETKKSFLTISEIKNLATAFAQLGCQKIRITGGEPSLRKDLIEIIQTLKTIPGIHQIAITTNGYKLKERINHWVAAGLTHLNVSVDSLDPKLFESLTGHNRLKDIMQGVKLALELPLQKVKLNAVLLKNINSHQLDDYLQLLKNDRLSLRFIELMQTGDNLDYFQKFHVSSDSLQNQLTTKGWQTSIKDPIAGPAIEYAHSDFKGKLGIIAPYAKDFCDSCNRLRVSAEGKFHLCLFGEQGFSIRHLLQKESQITELKTALKDLLKEKKPKHFLQQGNTGDRQHLASIGG